LYNDVRVFVKGPFKTELDARVSDRVKDSKNLLAPELASVDMSVVEAIVDVFPDTPLGLRKAMMGKTGYFQVATSLIPADVSIPQIERSTARAWTTPVQVVNWSELSEPRCLSYNKNVDESIYTLDVKGAIEVVKHVLLSCRLGTSADLAFRNFLFANGTCYQVDNDTIDNEKKWTLGKTAVGSMRTRAGPLMLQFIKDHWDTVFQEFTQRIGLPDASTVEELELVHFQLPPKRKNRKAEKKKRRSTADGDGDEDDAEEAEDADGDASKKKKKKKNKKRRVAFDTEDDNAADGEEKKKKKKKIVIIG